MNYVTPGNYIPTEYLPILILMIIAFVFAIGILLISSLFRLRRPYKDKLSPYESGNLPEAEPRYKFSVQFYIVAMLFVVFGAELVFIYPWALVFPGMGSYPFIAMMIFIAILAVGYIYDWKKGAFKW